MCGAGLQMRTVFIYFLRGVWHVVRTFKPKLNLEKLKGQ